MRTNDLIDQLSSNLKVVKPQWPPLKFLAFFLSFCFLIVAGGLVLVHVRSDWGEKISDLSFILDLSLSMGLIVSSLFVVGWLSSPGRGRGQLGIRFVLAVLFIMLVFGFLRNMSFVPAEFFDSFDMIGIKCFITVLCFSLIPSIAMGIAVRNRAPLRPGIIGIAIALASLGAGTFAITLNCSLDDGIHIAFFHFLIPLAVGASLGAWLGSRFIKW